MKLSIKDRFTILTAITAAFALLLLVYAVATLEKLRVGGAVQTQIQKLNTLNGDLQPPPLFFVEGGMHLYSAAVMGEPAEREAHWKEAAWHVQEFKASRAHWDTLLASAPDLRKRLMAATAPIDDVIDRLETEFHQPLTQGDPAKAIAFLDVAYLPAHERHDSLMKAMTEQLADLRRSQVEEATADARGRTMLLAIAALIFAAGKAWLVLTLRSRLHQAVINQRLVENAPVNIMMANRNLEITFANERSKQTLKSIEYAMPCKAEDILGKNIDIFHKNPQRVRKMLEDPSNLPHTATIQIGDDWMSQTVAAVRDEAGRYIGPMLVWEIATREVRRKAQIAQLQKEVADKVAALQNISAGLGRISDGMSRSTHDATSQTAHSTEAFGRVNQAFQMVASAAEEMSASVSEIARHVAEAARVATEAGQKAESVNAKIGDLDRSSREISKATEVVTAIAEQTNLLALNATIEAARAGEAGKGFAVVASEVKELAKQTSNATEDIRRMVGAIQSDVGGSVESISRIAEVVLHIRSLQDSIAAAVEQQNATARDIARSVSGAAQESQEIASVLSQLAGVVSESAQAATSSEAAAKELLALAGDLRKDMDSFRS